MKITIDVTNGPRSLNISIVTDLMIANQLSEENIKKRH